MASTGSRREADQAGINPDNNPIKAETNIPNKIFCIDKIIVKLVVEVIIKAMTNTINKPTIPPKTDKKTASNKNCNKTK